MTREQKILEKVAEAFLTPEEERRGNQRYIAGFGLCSACMYSGGGRGDENIPLIFKPARSNAYWIPVWDPESDNIRGLFALFLAEMPEKDFKELYENN